MRPKILYLTVPSYFDLEISLIREMSKLCDIDVMMIISPESQHSSAFSIDSLTSHPQIVKGCDFKPMEKYARMVDLKHWYLAITPVNSLMNCWKLARDIKSFIKRGHYDMVHSVTQCKTALFLSPFLSKYPHTLFTLHDPIPHDKPSKLNKLLKQDLCYKVFHNLLFLSPALESEFRKLYPSPKIKIFYSQLSIYDFLSTYPAKPNDYGKYILFFGRITKYKGLEVLVKAFLESQAKKDGYKLVIAGKGDIKTDTTDPSIVVLNRYIANDELANLIRDCQFVVLPYLSATQSGCVMSAYAFNKPILATNVGDLPLSVVDRKMGRIVEPNDVQDLCRGIDDMLKGNLKDYSDNIAQMYSNNGDASWQQVAKKLRNTYLTILQQRD